MRFRCPPVPTDPLLPRLRRVLVSALLLLTCPPVAAGHADSLKLYASLGILSDYRFFGASSSAGKPAVQGNLHLEHDDGWYAGVFSSSVDFDDGGNTRYEFDTYLGRTVWRAPWSFTAEVVYIAYDENHPGPTWDFWQGKLAMRRDFDTSWLDLSIAHTPEGASASGHQSELRLEGARELRQGLRVTGNLGYGVHEETPDRAYWALGVELDWRRLTFGIAWVGSDQSRAECFDTDWCSEAVVGSILLHSG